MGVNYIGYNYPISTGSVITTDSTPVSPKPGVAHYSGEVQPATAQVGDLWTSSLGIKRWDGTNWNTYVSSSGTTSSIKAGIVTFSGSSTTINFSSTFAGTPSVVVTQTGALSTDTGFLVYNVTPSSFSVQSYDLETGNAKSGTFSINWIAINQGVTGATTAGNVTNGTTDSNGTISVSFGYTYSAAPAVVASYLSPLPSGSSVYEPWFMIKNVTTTGFQMVFHIGDTSTPVGGGKTFSFSWIATPSA